MFGLFKRQQPLPSNRARLSQRDWHGYTYVIGDVHGCLSELRSLEALIAQDRAAHGQPSLIVSVGDYVDRGSSSAAVLDYLMAAPAPSFQRICLAGNHEEMMLDFIAAPQPAHNWLRFGGDATLRSYGLDPLTLFEGGKRRAAQRLESYIPAEHLDFLRNLAVSLSLPGHTIVHAGLAPGVILDEQDTQDMLWMRANADTYIEAQPFGILIHGHTPGPDPIHEPFRICVDTGAYATGILTAARLTPKGDISFISAKPGANLLS